MISNNTTKKSSYQPESESKVNWKNVGGEGTESRTLTLKGLKN